MDLDKLPKTSDPHTPEPEVLFIPQPRSHTILLILAFLTGLVGLYLMLPVAAPSGATPSPTPVATASAK